VAKLLIRCEKIEGCKNHTHLPYHRDKYFGDHASHAGCKQKSVMFVFYGIVLISGPKMGFFAPQERHVALINVKFGTGERTAVHQGRLEEIQPQKCQNLKFWP